MSLFSRKTKIYEKSPISFCHTIVLGGQAGEGIKLAGKILSNSLLSSGYEVYMYDEYPSLVRGGHNAVYITYSPYPVYSINREIDILICLDRNTFDVHKKNLNSGSIVIFDRNEVHLNDNDAKDYPCELISLPITNILNEKKLPRIILNIIYVSACLNIIGIQKDIADKIINSLLSHKKTLLDLNLLASNEAYKITHDLEGIKKYSLIDKKNKKIYKKNKYFIPGNEAIALGAITSGLGFYAAYPMTPASTLLDYLSGIFRKKEIIVKQTEDEISAINMAIGAAFAGSRSMVGTSGGGFSLMVEGLGLAAITETPITIVISQRPGPATGLPTWTGQNDLLFVLHSSQDEFPRIILTPTDHEEALIFGKLALNLAEKYQIPVIILSDKLLSESSSIIEYKENLLNEKIDRGTLLSTRTLSRLENFNRYEITDNGVSPRTVPGQPGGVFIANSDESDLNGFSEESSENRILKVQKRFKKLKDIEKDMPNLNIYGDIKSKLLILTWGSSKGAALEAIRRLQNVGINILLISVNYISPFPKEELEKFIENSNQVLLVESNFTSQFGQLIKLHTGYEIENKLLKYDGRPIFPDEIVNKVFDILEN